MLSALSYYNGPFAGQEDEFALYDENGKKIETSTSKVEGSGEWWKMYFSSIPASSNVVCSLVR